MAAARAADWATPFRRSRLPRRLALRWNTILLLSAALKGGEEKDGPRRDHGETHCPLAAALARGLRRRAGARRRLHGLASFEWPYFPGCAHALRRPRARRDRSRRQRRG